MTVSSYLTPGDAERIRVQERGGGNTSRTVEALLQLALEMVKGRATDVSGSPHLVRQN